MKESNSGKSKIRKQVKAAPNSASTPVDDYIARVEEPARSMLTKMRTAIRSALPREATEIISYRMPAFKHRKVLVWFGAFKSHCSLFPTAAVIGMFKDELNDYSTSKGTVHFPVDKPLPIALIKKLVKARLEQAENKRN